MNPVNWLDYVVPVTPAGDFAIDTDLTGWTINNCPAQGHLTIRGHMRGQVASGRLELAADHRTRRSPLLARGCRPRRALDIPRRVAARPSEHARLRVLVRTADLERRRLLLDRIGYESFLDIAKAKLRQLDDYGKLWRTACSARSLNSRSRTGFAVMSASS